MSVDRTIAVVTGTRAEFGLLRTVIDAIVANPTLELQLVVTGAHLLGEKPTVDEIEAAYPVAARIEMQRNETIGRWHDAAALGRGVSGLARLWQDHQPDVVLVLGDRIEALAAALAASVGGVHVAHLHGGDRAEGVADEAMRHAITKLAHLHFPATPDSAERIERMGESPAGIFMVGCPAVDGLEDMPAMTDDEYTAIGAPQFLVLLHPVGDPDLLEEQRAAGVIELVRRRGRVLVLEPNHDPGRNGILRAIESSGVPTIRHLPRAAFVGLLRRIRAIVGNSSAGLIEAAVLGTPAINLGSRQAGREKPNNVIDLEQPSAAMLEDALNKVADMTVPLSIDHPYGDGRTGARVAELLATIDLAAHPLRKRNSY